jgi:hypothetical protein
MQRIGRAETPRDSKGRVSLYGVYQDRGDTLTVSYEGYRIDDVTTGIPLGGHGWTPPTYPVMPRDRFAEVTIF